jgi:hypothetical protein
VDLGGQTSTTKHSNQPKVHGHDKGGKGDDVQEWGGAQGKGEASFSWQLSLVDVNNKIK